MTNNRTERVDIVEELSHLASSDDGLSPYVGNADVCNRARAEITRLRSQVERIFGIACDYTIDERTARSDIANIARTALEDSPDGR